MSSYTPANQALTTINAERAEFAENKTYEFSAMLSS